MIRSRPERNIEKIVTTAAESHEYEQMQAPPCRYGLPPHLDRSKQNQEQQVVQI
jgi:hypothetical protein